MSKNYQTRRGPAGTGGVTAKRTKASKAAPVPPATEVDPGLPGWMLPSSVQVAMVDLAETARGGLLALAVGTGLQVMQVLMDEDVTAIAGPKREWNPRRTAVRHGTDDGQVTLGGRRLPIRRPRVRAADGGGELPVRGVSGHVSLEVLALRVRLQSVLVHVLLEQEERRGSSADWCT